MPRELAATILTEAGPTIGLGHLTRCTALYDALDMQGCTCRLVIAGEAAPHVVGRRRCAVRDWRAAETAAEIVSGADIAVVDSYLTDLPVYEAIASTAPLAVYLDDTSRLPYPPGIVVNGNPEAAHLGFHADPDTQLLLGVRYQLLRSEFLLQAERTPRASVRRILVVTGGGSAGETRDLLAEVAARAYPDAFVDVVGAPRNASGMREAMLAADIAVSAAGQTLYELASLGTPTVAVTVADNQLAQASAFENAGALLLAGRWGEPQTVAEVEALLTRLAPAHARETMMAAGRTLVDGKGAERVTNAVIGGAIGTQTTIRLALPEDEPDLLELANEPSVRSASLSSTVITPDTHHAWYADKLVDPDTTIMILRVGPRLAAYVRFERTAGESAVSIALGPDYRGVGLASTWLHQAIDEASAAGRLAPRLVAQVREDNLASLRLFTRAGFQKDDSRSGMGVVTLVRATMSS